MPQHTPFVELVRAAWMVFQDHFKTIFMVVLLVLFPMNVLVDLTTVRELDWEWLIQQPLSTWNPMIWLNFALIVVSALLDVMVTAAVVVTTQRALKHEVTTPGQALGLAAGFWPKLLVNGFLVTIAVLVGLLLFILPGLLAAFAFFFSSFAVVLAGRWGFKAMGYSAKLVFHHPWIVLTRVVGAMILVAVPAFAISAASGQVELYGIPGVGATIVNIIAMYFTVFCTLLFLELEQRLLEK